MHDMSNTRKEIAARLGFAAGFGRDYPSKVTETAGASGGTWSKKMARYGSKKAAVITYTDGGQVGQVYQDPDNPRVFKAFDMGGRLLGEGSEMDMKRKVEAITASRPGAKVVMEKSIDELKNAMDKAVLKHSSISSSSYMAQIKARQPNATPSDIQQAASLKRKTENAWSEWLHARENYRNAVGLSMQSSRPGAKTRMTREQTEEQKAGLKIMSAADPAVGAKIAKLIKEGKPQDQAVAIALDMKRRGEL